MVEIQGVLFDIDGTLLDSNDAHAESYRLALSEHGHTVSLTDIRRLIGMGSDQMLPKLIQRTSDSAEGKAIDEAKGRIFDSQFFPKLRPFRDAHELVKTCASAGYRIGIATSADRAEMKRFLRRLEIENFIDRQTSSDDASVSKPDPAIILAALRKIRVAARDAVMIGDTPYDVEAARRAGVRAIAFRTGGWADRELREASAIFDGPWDLLASFRRLGKLLAD